jgi:multiple sugar transport system permease protein
MYSAGVRPHYRRAPLAVYRPELALAILLVAAPVLIVFLFAQRLLVAGLLAGATKG